MVSANNSLRQRSTLRSGTRCVGALLLCATFLAGCASTTLDADQAESHIAAAVKDADSEIANGHRDKAIEVLNQTAKENPASTVPWLKIANIWFDAGNYPSSILAANEVLQRDAKNQEAKSILVVAGLRVAAGAVTDLRSNDKVDTSSRVEAEHLTKALREMLGEDVLVPATAAAEKKTEARPVHTHYYRPRHHVVKAHVSTPTPAAAPDPFKALK